MDHERAALVREAIARDREAFSRLAAAHWRRLVRLARTVVADLDAEDVVQEGLVRAWQGIGSLREPAAFASWLGRIVVNVCLRHAGQQPRTTDLDDPAVAEVAGRDSEPAVASRLDVVAILRGLSPRQRAVLHLTAIEGMSDREIGVLLGVSPISVRVHRMRARQALQRSFGGHDHE